MEKIDVVAYQRKKRATKKELYKKEQEEILDKINNILGISKDNNTIILYDLENDADKRDKLLALSDDIQKAFCSSKWGFFTKDICKNNHVLLVKSVFKAMDLTIIPNPYFIVSNNNKIRTTKYKIGKFIY